LITHVPLSPSSIIWQQPRVVMACGSEGNRSCLASLWPRVSHRH